MGMTQAICWVLYIMFTDPQSGEITRSSMTVNTAEQCVAAARLFYQHLQDIGYDMHTQGMPETVCKPAITI